MLRNIRTRKNMGQAQVARLTGVSQSTISKWEKDPSLLMKASLETVLERIAGDPIFGVTLEELINGIQHLT